MPPDPQAPHEEPTKKNEPVDIGSLLLPKKEAPGTTLDSAQRVNASALLEQEQKAGSGGFETKLPDQKSSEQADQTFAQQVSPETKKIINDSVVKPLETYQSDIEQIMQGGNVSVVSIAAAEAKRRAQQGKEGAGGEAPTQGSWLDWLKKSSMIIAGVALLVIAAGTLAYFLLRNTSVNVAKAPPSPFILVDDTKAIALSPTATSREVMSSVTDAKNKVSLSLGLMERLIPSISSTTPNGTILLPLSAQDFLIQLIPSMPSNLLRTLGPTFLLGVHVYDSNQSFLILSTDSYQEAFSGMLSWELHMKGDLDPLFNYTPSPHINNLNTQTTTTGTSTLAATSSQGLQFVESTFVDKIVENHDARVLQNQTGDIYLMWTFIDRNTLVITTNAATLREIISRLQQAPVTAVPAQ